LLTGGLLPGWTAAGVTDLALAEAVGAVGFIDRSSKFLLIRN
jgi:hypothetical protein